MNSSDREENLRTEADACLEELGKELARLHDRAVLQTSFSLAGGNPRLYKRWQRYMDTQPDERSRQLKFAQMAIETILHDVLFCLQGQQRFRLQALTATGRWINLQEYSDGIHGDLFEWLERYSEYGCVTNEYLEME
jgi:hypothetical protein